MNEFARGDLVMVRNDPPEPGGVYYVQRFVTYHNGLYFCERDDGVKDQLIGWKYAIANQGHELVECDHQWVTSRRPDIVTGSWCHKCGTLKHE